MPAGNSSIDKMTELMKNNGNSVVGIAIQIIVGLLLTVLIYWLALFVMKQDRMVNNSNPNDPAMTTIITGYADSSELSKKTYNTVLPYAPNYMPLHPSSNIRGGAQFTYSFWLYVGNPVESVNTPIFIRGDSKDTYTYNSANKNELDYVAFCPLVEFGSNPLDFNIRFNTSRNINEIMRITSRTSQNNMYRKNMMSLLASQWFLVTIVFEDNIPINDFEQGLMIKFYVNDVLYQTGTWSSMLKQNNGNLFLFPKTSPSQCRISNFNYYNYAVSMTDVISTYRNGPSSTPATPIDKQFSSQRVLSNYNITDIYNT
jgi:hypothetical protein